MKRPTLLERVLASVDDGTKAKLVQALTDGSRRIPLLLKTAYELGRADERAENKRPLIPKGPQ